MLDALRPFIVTLERPAQLGHTLMDTRSSARSVVEQFRRALQQVVSEEGLSTELGIVQPTENLPIVFLTGTDRLAQRIRRMTDVRSVAQDMKVQLQTEIPRKGGTPRRP